MPEGGICADRDRMGDWILMEVKRKPKTIAAIFIRYISLFCVNTLLILGILFLAFSVLINTGGIRRADDMQTRLNENVSAIKKSRQGYKRDSSGRVRLRGL